MSFLEEIVDWTQQAVAERKSKRSLADLRVHTLARRPGRPFLTALQRPGISLIAEFKRSSPSQDAPIRTDVSVEDYVQRYEESGARALSILTEEKCFHGSLKDLRVARQKTTLPLLRKDFIIDEYQVYEAAESGADAILLIAAVLDDDAKLAGLHRLARGLNLDVLLEVRDVAERDRALQLGADLIGINNRDLKTQPTAPRAFDVDTERTRRLFDGIPSNVTVVAESGLTTRVELDGLEAIGVDAALIGSALMGAPDVAAKCREFTQRPEGDANTARPSLPAFA